MFFSCAFTNVNYVYRSVISNDNEGKRTLRKDSMLPPHLTPSDSVCLKLLSLPAEKNVNCRQGEHTSLSLTKE